LAHPKDSEGKLCRTYLLCGYRSPSLTQSLEALVCRLNAKNEKICVIFLCVEKGADKGWPLDRSQEIRKIMRQSPCFTLLHALAFLADSQQFDEKVFGLLDRLVLVAKSGKAASDRIQGNLLFP
jgi:hypothetical protein